MKLDHEFYRLPLQFDSERLAGEVAQFTEAEWRPHPQGHKGNSALPLIAANGDPANEATKGPMQPTPYLARCPYLQQALAALGAPIGRTRLMRIEGHGEATAHVDTNYYWSQRVRVHIPILTYPGVRFLCGEREVFMAAGECWIFDTWRRHNVLNPDDRPRIHLVADTVGSDTFWEMVAWAGQPFEPGRSAAAPSLIPYRPDQIVPLETEAYNFPVVMSPWEAQGLIKSICDDLAHPMGGDSSVEQAFKTRLERFLQRWRALWTRFGAGPAGWPGYQAALQRLEAELAPLKGRLRLVNGSEAVEIVRQWLIWPALNPDLAHNEEIPPAAGPAIAAGQSEDSPAKQVNVIAKPAASPPRLERPVFIVAAPRSGSTLLFETLAQAANVYSLGRESHEIIEGIAELAPASHGFASNRLTAIQATPQVVARLEAAFLAQVSNRDGQPPPANVAVRLLEKTPKNALRIPFLAAAFPDARFIYLYREPHESLASIMQAWRSGRFVTYPRLPGWDGPAWSLLLIPNWPALRGKSLAEIAAAQWETANRQILDDLAALPSDHWTATGYAALLADPQAEMERLCRFAGFRWDRPLAAPLPLSRHTLTPPDPQKWRTQADLIEPVVPLLAETDRRARQTCSPAEMATETEKAAQPMGCAPGVRQRDGKAFSSLSEGEGPGERSAPLRSVHTASLPGLLHELGISLFVSTYQAGKLVVLRANQDLLNTHFRNFNKPMGLALQGGRLAVGVAREILEFHNTPATARKLTPPDRHDACFLPRRVHTSGDVQIHEMAWVGEALWFVNTRFSCLSTYSPDYSFVPLWRPRFISALAPDDRCHLNGLALRAGQPAFVTALGESDEPKGWRAGKKDGGLLIDLASDEVIVRGLSMPHSPRWYAGRLWLLNSGQGSVGIVDLAGGRYQEVARLPGFTRGLDFYDRYAFIGLSQVRESAVFSGIAIAGLPLAERACGVWVLDITTGQTVAFVKFEEAVQEIFAVQVAPGLRFPDIITDDHSLISSSYILPDEALKSVPAHLR